MRAVDRERLSAEYAYQAAEELKNAGIMRDNRSYSAACFHAQQAAEGMLKAVLIGLGTDSLRIHHLDDLMGLIPEPQQVRILQHREKALLLEKYYLPTRYVDALGGKAPAKVFTLRDARGAIEAAETIVAVCREIMASPEHLESGHPAPPVIAKAKPTARGKSSRRKPGR